MKLKRIILTALAAIVYWGVGTLFKLFYSPITGVATAKTVNDSPADYGMAKFIRDGGVEATLFYLFLLALLILWAKPLLGILRPKNNPGANTTQI